MLPKEDASQAQEQPRLRADAQRNRAKLVEVASQAFAERGADVSLEEIARQAGVGIGTLYRHFPTREHLVEAAYRHELELLAGAAAELLAEKAPDIALDEWMHRFVSYMAAKRGMAKSLKLLFTSNAALFTEGTTRMTAAFEKLLRAAIEAGTVKGDIVAGDVLYTLFGIYSIPDTPDWRERAHRIVRLIMDGLRIHSKA
ncbi:MULTISPECIES: TetR/AcrR family transcriptional regulator [unclassified Rhizobium]|uniref:TetR/AcrR family transcriptional regulator n=1 Tax=unclassified Rhizobium TaxID=2613769 RepID=UPI001ADB0A19|nr:MULTISPECIES: TetR/AcrR family transcriptional regulator [unclassified Rhizobium]MBO9124040.1 TetR/AcrR family transcriptional regulator [Rhizobium sp. 16-488-2b]MBO9174572.1 TetR/AcrR family transcriptional regulator [Rhizobium sp. 16-488-2a]